MTPPGPAIPRIGKRKATMKSTPVARLCTASFVVLGVPKPKPRAKVTRFGNFLPAAYTEWRERVKDEAGVVFAELADRGEPWDATGSAYEVRCRFFVERMDRGDLDNLIGGLLDALNRFAWADDRLVVEVRGTKQLDKEQPRMEVEIRTVEAL